VWIISIAQAAGRASSIAAGRGSMAAAAASASIGRRRLPPAKTL